MLVLVHYGSYEFAHPTLHVELFEQLPLQAFLRGLTSPVVVYEGPAA